MSLKVNEFVIQAKVIEEGATIQRSSIQAPSDASGFTDSIKKELLDELRIEVKKMIREEIDAQRLC